MKRSPQEITIVELARAIETGKLAVSGTIDLSDIGTSVIEVSTLESLTPPPDYFELNANLYCKRI